MQTEIEPRLFRRVMSRFPTGVAVISAMDGLRPRGMTANAFMSGSLEPPLCVVSVAKRAHMHGFLLSASRFGVSVLSAEQEDLSVHFAGGPTPAVSVSFEEIADVPLLVAGCARIAAERLACHDCGDHTLFVGHILHMDASERLPLLYHAGRYARLVHPRGEHEVEVPEFW